MTDNPTPLPNPRRSPDADPPLPVWMTLPGSLAQPSAPNLEREPADPAPPADGVPTEPTPAPPHPAPPPDPPADAHAAAPESDPATASPPPEAPVADPAEVASRLADVDSELPEPEPAEEFRPFEVDPRVSGADPGLSEVDGGPGRPEGHGFAGGEAPEPDDGDGAGNGADDAVGDAVGDGQERGGPTLEAALEAILLVVDEPVAEVTLAQVLERPTHEVAAALRRLAAEYTAGGRGFDLREVAGGWRFYTRAQCAPLVERFVRDGQQTRLTQAALETLAVVAYRQPVSRARVAAVRGVNSDGVMRTLVARGLVEEAGTDPESQAVLYRTSSYFLERLGLRDLSELPELAPFLPDDVENLEETTK